MNLLPGTWPELPAPGLDLPESTDDLAKGSALHSRDESRYPGTTPRSVENAGNGPWKPRPYYRVSQGPVYRTQTIAE